ncbi:MAG: 50S ribosomal protein L31e [Candidatus Micrarchaeia archaeon]
MANLERIYTIPMAKAYDYIRTKRARRAIKVIREFALRHMKAEDAKISEGVNAAIFRNGMQKPPRRIKVRIVKGEDGVAKVWLIGEEEKIKETAKKKEDAKKAAEKKLTEAKPKADAKKEEAKPAAAAPKQEAKDTSPRPSQNTREKPAPLQKPHERRDGL